MSQSEIEINDTSKTGYFNPVGMISEFIIDETLNIAGSDYV